MARERGIFEGALGMCCCIGVKGAWRGMGGNASGGEKQEEEEER